MKKVLFVLSLFLVVFFFTSSVSYSQNSDKDCDLIFENYDCADILDKPNLENLIDLQKPEDFRYPKDQVVLSKKVQLVLNRIKRGAYLDALKKLARDVLPKVDGIGNDWIIDPDAQEEVYWWAKGLECCMLDAIYN